jgi:DNA-binding response OmpR family regulator
MQPHTPFRIAGLFANKAREAAVRTLLGTAGLDLLPAASIGALVAMLRDGKVEVLLLEDAGPALGDWLGMLQLRVTGAAPVIVAGTPGGLGLAEALRLGAADYIDHDAAAGQWAARLSAHAGTQRSRCRQDLELGPFRLCSGTSTVLCEGTEVHLTAREFALAWALSSRAGRIVPLASLSAHVWGRSSDVCKRTLEQHVHKLRRKLGAPGCGRLRIQAIYGIGYRLDVLNPHATLS